MTKATTESRFFEYAKDAGNWGGYPLIGGNVGGDAADKGFIVNMKKRGLITTFVQDGDIWMDFTEKGLALALENGIEIEVG